MTKEGIKHDEKLVHKILSEELEDILKLRKTQITDSTQYSKVADFYKKAFKISQRWIRNYVDLNFASLGSYTRQQLLQIGNEEDALLQTSSSSSSSSSSTSSISPKQKSKL